MFVGRYGSGFLLCHHFSLSLRKCIMVNAYIKKGESSPRNDLTLYPKELEKEQAKLKVRDANNLTWNSNSGDEEEGTDLKNILKVELMRFVTNWL